MFVPEKKGVAKRYGQNKLSKHMYEQFDMTALFHDKY